MSQQVLSAETTVGQLVVERPGRARVFEKFGIDYCCGGKKPLVQACEEKGLQVDAVLASLADEQAGGRQEGERDWSKASMTDLCDHIEQAHHAYLRDELPRLDFLTAKVSSRHGDRLPNLVRIREVFVALREELEQHMLKEERVLFPICRQMDNADGPIAAHCGSVRNPIAVMVAEHDHAGDALEQFRALTDNYQPPADACNTFRAMYDALRQLEADMHQHVHKENNILFPKAERFERLLAR